MSQKTDPQTMANQPPLMQPQPEKPQPSSTAVKPEDIELLTDGNAALFQTTPRLGSWIIRGFLAFLVCFFVWAYFAKIDEITVG